MSKVKLLCPHCGSDDIVRDSSSEWDTTLQEWVTRAVYDHMACETCEREFKEADEEDIEDAPVLTTRCTVCHEQQFTSPSGNTCPNGHGGDPGYEP